MLPVAIVDPALTHDLPPAITAATGMDALTQLIEPFTSPSQPAHRRLCREAIPCRTRFAEAFAGDPAPYRNGLRQPVYGLAPANAGLGVVHGFASPIGMYEFHTAQSAPRYCRRLCRQRPPVLERLMRLQTRNDRWCPVVAPARRFEHPRPRYLWCFRKGL